MESQENDWIGKWTEIGNSGTEWTKRKKKKKRRGTRIKRKRTRRTRSASCDRQTDRQTDITMAERNRVFYSSQCGHRVSPLRPVSTLYLVNYERNSTGVCPFWTLKREKPVSNVVFHSIFLLHYHFLPEIRHFSWSENDSSFGPNWDLHAALCWSRCWALWQRHKDVNNLPRVGYTQQLSHSTASRTGDRFVASLTPYRLAVPSLPNVDTSKSKPRPTARPGWVEFEGCETSLRIVCQIDKLHLVWRSQRHTVTADVLNSGMNTCWLHFV